jgi:hypothetical protein
MRFLSSSRSLTLAGYWFLAAESELRIKNITSDLTKFSYVVSSTKGDVFNRMINLIRVSPQTGVYQGLKDRLLQAFGRTQMEWANAVMDWPGLGNLKPLVFYKKMADTLPEGRIAIIFWSRHVSSVSCRWMYETTYRTRWSSPPGQSPLRQTSSSHHTGPARTRCRESPMPLNTRAARFARSRRLGGSPDAPGTSRMKLTSARHMPGGATRHTPAKAGNVSWGSVRLQ